MSELCDDCGHPLPNAVGPDVYCTNCGAPVHPVSTRKPVKPSSRPERGGRGSTPREGLSAAQEAQAAVRDAVVTASLLGFDEGVVYVLSILDDLGMLTLKAKVQAVINEDRGRGAYARNLSDLHRGSESERG